MNSIDPNANRLLVGFIRSYTDLLEKSLQGIHDEMRATVDGVMAGINQISAKSAEHLRQAGERQATADSANAAVPAISNATQLEKDLETMLLNMMGALSRDDVISQRIHHVVTALGALTTSLNYILTDFETRCRTAEIERLTKELKIFVLRSYTMEEEKQQFYSVFPQDKGLKKSA